MSFLSDTLDRMLFWVNKYLPEYARDFQPGLTESEIQMLTRNLEIQLPEDFYKLYQWRNGNPNESCRSCSPVFYFLPLENVVRFKKWTYDVSFPQYKEFPLLPFVTTNCDYYAIVLERNYSTEAHIVMVNEIGEVMLQYDSITSMIESITDCFETKAYYLNNNGFIEENEKLSVEVLRVKNPRTVSEVVVDLKENITAYITSILLEQDSDDYRQDLNSLPGNIMVYDVNNLIADQSYQNCRQAIETLKRFHSLDAMNVLREALDFLEKQESQKASNAWNLIHLWLLELNVI